MKRPFWMHQLVEYILGVLLVSQGLQASKPMVPTLLGGLVVVNAATAKGPAAAFPKLSRRVHRVIDVVLLGLMVVGACLPSSMIDDGARLVLGGAAAVFGFVAWKTDYTTKVTRRERRAASRPDRSRTAAASTPPAQTTTPSDAASSGPGPGTPRPAPTFDSEQIGRAAGRTAGRVYNAARRRRRS